MWKISTFENESSLIFSRTISCDTRDIASLESCGIFVAIDWNLDISENLFRFLSLVHPGDGEEYSKTSFLGARIEKFKFIILTQLWNPNEDLLKQTYPLRVMIPSKSTSY